jgi:hypothetical protein
MVLQHLSIKVFVEAGRTPDLEKLILLFHEWIQAQETAGEPRAGEGISGREMLIDVADYRHVHRGPGIVLVAHEALISLDLAEGRPGLLYNRRAPLALAPPGCLAAILSRALFYALRLEDACPRDPALQFNRRQLEFCVNDRAIAPNTPETFQSFRPLLEELSSRLDLGECLLEHHPDPRRRFRVLMKTFKALDFRSALDRLQS